MTKEQIEKLLSDGRFPELTHQKKLVETHISWVILCDEFVYKIKKPILYSFLDFSTLPLRKHYCKREIELNRRLSKDVYLEVLPVSSLNGKYGIGEDEGEVIDYAVRMRKLDPEKQMDVLLSKDKVRPADIKKLAKYIAVFHKKTEVIYKKDLQDDKNKFNELKAEKEFLSENLGQEIGNLIDRAIERSNIFLNQNSELLESRLSSGFFRDCHGDLHTRNIFLLPAPQPFDCIEFNDDYRQIDVLNEVAFLCMDLDALQREDLSRLFIEHYNLHFPAMRNNTERQLFINYKSYRANVRAKVNSLRASGSSENSSKKNALQEAEKYLKLMGSYLDRLEID
ncbi:hypothetical protein FHG64_11740 [Antarcticibacterium flavum]|uniref:Aminoglycoside phosphotransferase domain-containing protein n=1 Tax=Antarcticibacterium flavum TaxID=2058175 RepID=A0A5B7X3C5_9FLAO|nr:MULTISPECIES: hypothetical protein [Antarcticibacterium]MCM4161581.1 hypothetical protein [Antarcticibacterium sp. W02-3]QCY70016.1 hypothetical protein FHG64_11740 [Antarcticibacterium flavum]